MAVFRLKNFIHSFLCRPVPTGLHITSVRIPHCIFPGFQLADAHQNAAEQVRSLKPRHHHGRPVTGGQTPVIHFPRDGADMAGSQESVRPSLILLHQPFQSRGNQHMGAKNGKIGIPQCTGLLQGKSRSRGRRLKTYGEKHHFRIRMASGISDRFQRRIHQKHVPSPGLGGKQIPAGARHPHHIPVAAQNHAGPQA